MCAFVLFWVSFPNAWTAFASSEGGRGRGGRVPTKKQILIQIQSTKKHMPQLEDNIYVKFIAYFMGNNGLYQVYSCIELFDVGLWCLHEIKITLFSIVISD